MRPVGSIIWPSRRTCCLLDGMHPIRSPSEGGSRRVTSGCSSFAAWSSFAFASCIPGSTFVATRPCLPQKEKSDRYLQGAELPDVPSSAVVAVLELRAGPGVQFRELLSRVCDSFP